MAASQAVLVSLVHFTLRAYWVVMLVGVGKVLVALLIVVRWWNWVVSMRVRCVGASGWGCLLGPIFVGMGR